jgi:ABC-type branched-subunit amino acid transport system ATPase component
MLTAENMSFSFGIRSIISGACFELAPGSISCLLGGNGSGKTTLLNLITGFLRPRTGFIRWNGVNLVGLPSFKTTRLGIARTFQNQRLISNMSVRENILFALQTPLDENFRSVFHRRHTRSSEKPLLKAEELVELYSLNEVADQCAGAISHGQQKLLTLACCEALRPNLLLLDEPVAGISPELRIQIADRLLDLKAQGKTLLVIEHQADFLERIGDGYLFLDAGQLTRFETFSDVSNFALASELID